MPTGWLQSELTRFSVGPFFWRHWAHWSWQAEKSKLMPLLASWPPSEKQRGAGFGLPLTRAWDQAFLKRQYFPLQGFAVTFLKTTWVWLLLTVTNRLWLMHRFIFFYFDEQFATFTLWYKKKQNADMFDNTLLTVLSISDRGLLGSCGNLFCVLALLLFWADFCSDLHNAG